MQFPARYKTSGRKDSPFLLAKYIESYEGEAEMFTRMLELSLNS